MKKSDKTEQEVDEQIDEEEAETVEESDGVATIQHQLNILRGEYLDARSKSINRWLAFICIVLLFFTILIPIITGLAAYFIYDEFSDLQTEMSSYVQAAEAHSISAAKDASEVSKLLKEIKDHNSAVKGIVSKLTSKEFTNPSQVEILQSSIEDILNNPAISLEDKAIIEAFRLQRDGNIPEAIEKWRSIANTAKGVNDELVARAFFSIGYLHLVQNEEDNAVSAFDKSIELMPTYADAYTSRGIVHAALGNLEAAISDHSEAIRLAPDLFEAYISRGTVNQTLNQHENAILDFDIAIELEPNSAVAYTHRGVSRNALGRYQEAVADHTAAIRINENYVEAYINRGSAKRALGDHEGGQEDIDKAVVLTTQGKDE